jgi:plastocyanin
MYAVQAITTGLLWSNTIRWNSSLPHTPDVAPTATSPNTTRQIVDVVVGAQGKLAFNPQSVTVLPGTLLRFDFLGRNHTLTQSSLEHPCSNSSRLDTGFNQFNPQNISGKFAVEFWVGSSEPQWFFCAQNLPRSHCAAGMVFSLNPGGLIDEFRSNARVTPASTTLTAASYCNRTSSRGSSDPGQTSTPRFSSLGASNTSEILLSSDAEHSWLGSMNMLLVLLMLLGIFLV